MQIMTLLKNYLFVLSHNRYSAIYFFYDVTNWEEPHKQGNTQGNSPSAVVQGQATMMAV